RVLLLICLNGGPVAFLEMGCLENPKLTNKEAIVTVQYPGGTAIEDEQEVNETLESTIQELAEIKEIHSRSMIGQAEIRVEIQDRYTGDQLAQIWDKLRNKLDDARQELPPGIDPPLVNDDFGDVYGIFFALTGEGLTLQE